MIGLQVVRLNNGLLNPIAYKIENKLRNNDKFKIKELIIISIENEKIDCSRNDLFINHKYILLYKKIDDQEHNRLFTGL